MSLGLSCGICDVEHPDAEAEVTASAVVFLGCLEANGYEVRKRRG